MNNWIGPTVKQVWNIAMHVLHNFFGLLKTQQLTHLGRYSLHLLTYLSVCHCLFFVALVWSFRTLLFVFVSYFYLSFLQHFLIEYLCNTQFVPLPFWLYALESTNDYVLPVSTLTLLVCVCLSMFFCLDLSLSQCDQIGRFIGHWATF